MTIIYTNQTSKLTKKQRARREALLKEQRAIKKELKTMQSKRLSFVDPKPARRTVEHFPSLDTGGGSTTKRDAPVYTGSAMIGIGQLHKSNAVPVFKQEDAEDIAKMRR